MTKGKVHWKIAIDADAWLVPLRAIQTALGTLGEVPAMTLDETPQPQYVYCRRCTMQTKVGTYSPVQCQGCERRLHWAPAVFELDRSPADADSSSADSEAELTRLRSALAEARMVIEDSHALNGFYAGFIQRDTEMRRRLREEQEAGAR